MWAMNFSVNPNQPVIISPVSDKELQVPDSLTWTYGAGIANDPESLSFVTSIKLNGSSVIPSWLINDPSTFSFSVASSSNSIAGIHTITLVANDGFNSDSEMNFTLTINANLAPVRNQVIDNQQVVNDNLLHLQLNPVDVLFTDPDNRTLTPIIRLANGDPLPSFLTFNVLNNTLYGIPADIDVGVWNLEYVATNDVNLTGVISFKLTVKGSVCKDSSSTNCQACSPGHFYHNNA